MKTDTIFYQLFQAFPSIFFELINRTPEEAAESSIGVGVVKLVIEPQQTAPALAKRLIGQAKQQLTDDTTKRDIIDLIETIIVYKLPQKSREEIEAMLGLNELKQTKVYQEAFVEGEQIGELKGELKAKLTAIPDLIQLGLNLTVIAGVLKLPVELVQQVAQSFHAQNITAFIELLTQQRSLFSAEDITNLTQFIAPLPDEIENLSLAIEQWCKQPEHSAKIDALLQVRQTLLSSIIEIFVRKNTDTILTSENFPNKQMLQNAIEIN